MESILIIFNRVYMLSTSFFFILLIQGFYLYKYIPNKCYCDYKDGYGNYICNRVYQMNIYYRIILLIIIFIH